MKKLVSILILFVLLTGNGEFRQLLKLPFLFIHFSEHLSEDRSLSFAGFIRAHYRGNAEERKDERHEKLPFKSLEFQQGSQVMISEFSSQVLLFQFTPSDPSAEVYTEKFYQTDRLSSIWQPPQFV